MWWDLMSIRHLAAIGATLLTLALVVIVLRTDVIQSVDAAPDQTPPEADAGPDQLIDEVVSVHLDGSASSDDVGIERYTWTLEYEGATVTLEGMHAYFDIRVHGNYTVTLTVEDGAGNVGTDELLVTVLPPPGPPTKVMVIAHSHWNEILWSDPHHNGGSEVTDFLIFKGRSPDDLFPFSGNWYMDHWHWDAVVENGLTYHYAVAAINEVGMGPLSTVVNATPMAVPDVPQNLVVEYRDGVVHLSWDAPNETFGHVAVTGYEVHRGTDPDWLYDTWSVGMNTTFADPDVEEGVTYYYAVGATSHLGSSTVTQVEGVTVEDEEEGAYVTVIAMTIVTALFGVILGLLYYELKQA